MRGHYRTYFIHRKDASAFVPTITDAIFVDYSDDSCNTVVGATSVSISRKDAARALRRARNYSGTDATYKVERRHYVDYCPKCKRT